MPLTYVRCIKEWRSVFGGVADFGRLGSVYTVVPNPTPGYEHCYLTLAELQIGYLNKERFEPVTVTPCAP